MALDRSRFFRHRDGEGSREQHLGAPAGLT
jgi:hypothetical protein